MRTHLSLPYEHPTPLPTGYAGEVRTPPALVERLLERYTAPGDRVLDPFAGFGTTLAVAGRLDREAWGVEYEPRRVEHVRERVAEPDRVLAGDALALDDLDLPPADCVVTSPPFMARGMTTNPFENYAGESDYERYLGDVATAFEGVRAVVADDARVLVDVVNIRHDGDVTRLAWDVGEAIAGVDGLHFDGELVVAWTGASEGGADGDRQASREPTEDGDRDGTFGYGYDHSYVLTYSVTEQ